MTAPVDSAAELTNAEMRALTRWKWGYVLEGMGFSSWAVNHLRFLTWLEINGRI